MTARPFTYGSVCSGIEAATMAWHGLGWKPAFFSEIEAFPSAVLAHHYGSNMPGDPLAKNGIPNHGDFTKITAEAGPVDLLVGGTPCQSFSVAGKRLGLDDPRGNLALEYLALAQRLRARWFVWENVPGVLSSNTDAEDGDGDLRSGLEGRQAGDEWVEESDFATFLTFVRQCGYGFAYRILDAQYVRSRGFERAVPQRRRRLFVVGYLGDWRPAAAVLFDPESMRGNSAPRRQSRQGFAPPAKKRAEGGGVEIAAESDVSGTVSCKWAKGTGGPAGDEVQNIVATREVAATLTRGAESAGKGGYAGRRQEDGDNLVAHTLLAKANDSHAADLDTYVAHTLRAEGFDASEDGTGRDTPIVPVVFALQENAGADNLKAGPGGKGWSDTGVAYTIEARHHVQSVAFDLRGREGGAQMEGPHDTANIRAASGGSSRSYVAEPDNQQWAVRRLTPRECERLQGFPDDFTRIPWRGKPAAECPDGPRYKGCGNSMPVNIMEWLGERIHIFETEVKGNLP